LTNPATLEGPIHTTQSLIVPASVDFDHSHARPVLPVGRLGESDHFRPAVEREIARVLVLVAGSRLGGVPSSGHVGSQPQELWYHQNKANRAKKGNGKVQPGEPS
jgi:hypothetical protein